jgi:hypothetical protein
MLEFEYFIIFDERRTKAHPRHQQATTSQK